MGTRFRSVLLLVLFLFLCGAAASQEQDDSPVLIQFDKTSARIDLVTGEKIPDYTKVKRGSFLFYLDGVNKANPAALRFIRKLDSRYDIWRFRYKNGGKNTPRIHHKAVSFIPLDASGTPKDRVYVLFNDLSYIEWGESIKK